MRIAMNDDTVMAGHYRRLGRNALAVAQAFLAGGRPFDALAHSRWLSEARVCYTLAARHRLSANRHICVGRVSWAPR